MICQLALLRFVTSSFVPDEAAMGVAELCDLAVEVALRLESVIVAVSHTSSLVGKVIML